MWRWRERTTALILQNQRRIREPKWWLTTRTSASTVPASSRPTSILNLTWYSTRTNRSAAIAVLLCVWHITLWNYMVFGSYDLSSMYIKSEHRSRSFWDFIYELPLILNNLVNIIHWILNLNHTCMNHRLKVEMCGKQVRIRYGKNPILYFILYLKYKIRKLLCCVQTLTSLRFMILFKISCDFFFLGGVGILLEVKIPTY